MERKTDFFRCHAQLLIQVSTFKFEIESVKSRKYMSVIPKWCKDVKKIISIFASPIRRSTTQLKTQLNIIVFNSDPYPWNLIHRKSKDSWMALTASRSSILIWIHVSDMWQSNKKFFRAALKMKWSRWEVFLLKNSSFSFVIDKMAKWWFSCLHACYDAKTMNANHRRIKKKPA